MLLLLFKFHLPAYTVYYYSLVKLANFSPETWLLKQCVWVRAKMLFEGVDAIRICSW